MTPGSGRTATTWPLTLAKMGFAGTHARQNSEKHRGTLPNAYVLFPQPAATDSISSVPCWSGPKSADPVTWPELPGDPEKVPERGTGDTYHRLRQTMTTCRSMR